MTKYLNFFESESGFTEAVEAGQLFFPNVSYTEVDDTVHWNLTQPANPVETPMLRMHFSTSSPGREVNLHRNDSDSGVTAMEIDGTPVNFVSGGTYSIAEPGNHAAVYQFASPKITPGLFDSESGAFDTFTSAEITSAVTSIDVSAFKRCSGLTGVSMPDSVTRIGNTAFNSCSSLQSVVLSDNLTTIGIAAFGNCSGLTSIDIPDSVTTIDDLAFAHCGLRHVTVPDSVTSIGWRCFEYCTEMESATIGSGVTVIKENAFSGCTGLTAIYFNSETPPTLRASALDYTNDCPIYVPAASVETYQQAWPGYASRIMPMGGVQYNITLNLNDSTLGEVSIPETASEGDYVDFHVSVFDSEQNQVSSVTVTDGNGSEVECTEDWDNHYSFTMPNSDVTISVVIGEKPKTMHTVTVNSTDDLVTDVLTINPETGDWYSEGELSFLEGEPAVFAFTLPEGYQAVSVQASGCWGDIIDEVELNDLGDGMYECFFPMPGCDVSVFIEVAPVE